MRALSRPSKRRRSGGQAAGILATLLSGAHAQPPALAAAENNPGPALAAAESDPTPSRIIHRFDFDERDEGNLEPEPMYWVKCIESFPAFVSGRFDPNEGRDAPPSFYLNLNGRGVAYRYNGPDTPVEPGSDYVIQAWIKPDRLIHSRAYVSGYFLDDDRLPLAGTQRFSAVVDGSAEEWTPVTIRLATAPDLARTIGLTAWVVHEHELRSRPSGEFDILHYDVDAGAWFDDVVVYRLPALSMTTSASSSVLAADEAPVLLVTVCDPQPAGLTAEVLITSADGAVVGRWAAPVQASDEPSPTTIDLGALLPGFYRARLEAWSGQTVLAALDLALAKIEGRQPGVGSAAHEFGVVIRDSPRAPPAVESDLVRRLGVGSVKMPAAPPSGSADPAAEAMARDGDWVTAVAALGGQSTTTTTETDSDPWADLVATAAPNATAYRAWQLGTNDAPWRGAPAAAAALLDRMRSELSTVVTAPVLAATGSVLDALPSSALPAEEITLTIPPDVPVAAIADYLAPCRELGYLTISAYVPPLPEGQYERLARLADWAKRLVAARHGGADVVYVPQPWTTTTHPDGVLASPTEEFVVFQSIVSQLGDASPADAVALDEHTTALVFSRAESSVLALWDDAAPPDGRVHRVQLGAGHTQVDPWGRSTPLERGLDGVHEIRLFRWPVFVTGTQRWVMSLRTALSISPGTIEPSVSDHDVTVHLKNPHHKPLSGRVHLVAPQSWTLSPTDFDFSLPGGEAMVTPARLRIPINEPAGHKEIVAELHLESPEAYLVSVPVPLKLGSPDIDVWGYAVADGDAVILRHGVTNWSDQPLSFRSQAVAPGHSRQERVITQLLPGQTATRDYRFAAGSAALAGRTMRLTLREIDGPRHHVIEVVGP